jgi:hypothetical protein
MLLALVAGAANALPVTLIWDAPFGYVPTGYVLGYGEASGAYSTFVDVGDTRKYTIDNLLTGRTYYLSVRAYAAGGSSAWANEIVVAALNDPPPLSVSVSPVVGLWGNRDEPGTGYSLDFKHGVLVVIVYSYTTSGEPQWYIASGPLTGTRFTGRLDRFAGGPCISCPYAGAPVAAGSAGTITIVFSSATSATVFLPDDRTTEIQPTTF